MKLKTVVSALLSIVFVFAGGVFFLFYHSLPKENGELVFPGVSSPVEVTADALGLPSITAVNRFDAFRVLGFYMREIDCSKWS